MKILTLFFSMLLVLSVFASDTASEKISKKSKSKKNKKETKTVVAKAPCDSKEDVLKKLEEKKKLEEEAHKGFSLQGGNTGCSVK